MYAIDNPLPLIQTVLQDTYYTVKVITLSLMIFGVLGCCDLGKKSRLLAKNDMHAATLVYTKENIMKIFVVVLFTEALAI